MSDNFENRYQDVLQNIEFAIVSVYREHAELADSNVDRSLEGLIRSYAAEATGKPTPTLKLNELDQLVFERTRQMCEWRLGRGEGLAAEESMVRPEPKTIDEIIACLKRIRKSVKFWTTKNGRQGYVNYANQFIL